jgi:hypothetical protein
MSTVVYSSKKNLQELYNYESIMFLSILQLSHATLKLGHDY